MIRSVLTVTTVVLALPVSFVLLFVVSGPIFAFGVCLLWVAALLWTLEFVVKK